MKIHFLSAFTLLAGVLSSLAADPTPEQIAFFESKIRPILADKCYKCHSVEQGKAKGGLTLDTPDGVKKGGEDGPALVPGDPDKSKIIIAVRYTDPDMQMPPKGEKISDAEVAALAQWVKMGAPDPRKAAGAAKLSGLTDKAKNHWAYQPVKKPALPTNVKNRAWCVTPVDLFVAAKLEEHHMAPSPIAEKETLLRRVSYDLTGLPPEPREVSAFMADTSPKAFEKVVDRLLASPHYGERWGRFWLDTARYADTVGRNVNVQRADYRYTNAWTYRDYVINAFNTDKPYDQFILEQLAADKLPQSEKNPTILAALGFITVGERFNNQNDVIDDRINVVSKGFLGMTVSCARCHDHKFDPIPTKDYYSWHGIFSSCTEPQEKPIIRPPNPAQFSDFQMKLAAMEKQNRDAYYGVMQKGIAEFQKKVPSYLKLAALGGGGKKRTNTEVEKERIAIIQEGKLDRDIGQAVSRRVRDGGGDGVLFPYKMFADIPADEFAQKAPKLAADIGDNKSPNKKKVNSLVAAAFKGASLKSMDDVSGIYEKLFSANADKTKTYLAAAAAWQTKGTPVAGVDADLAQLVEEPFRIEPAAELNMAHLREVADKLPNQMLGRAGFIFDKINELELTHPGAPVRAMVLNDKAKPQNSPVFIRGESQNRGDVVPRRFLTVLSGGNPQPFKEGSGRLELAKAIATKDNPLTARVLVNRVWMHHFGEGFVRTPDDLGNMSEPPTHPELLDYLSSYFMENGWSLKRLHKLILMSKVYQESSYTHPEFEKVDPENRLLWRANVRRLDFEAVRDTLLVFSGRLDRGLDPKTNTLRGGQPVNITDEPYSYRRSVYGYIDRGNLPELMAHFDFSDPEMPNSKRASTIVPQQALFLMNSPMTIDVARRVVARPEVATARNDIDKIYMIYRVIFQRAPKPGEVQLAQQFLNKEQLSSVHFGSQEVDQTKAANLLTDKEKKKLANRKTQGNGAMRAIQNQGDVVDRKQLNPWETYAQALLLSNEASYVN